MIRPRALAISSVVTERTRGMRFHFEPGAETGRHDHGITAIKVCQMLSAEPGGEGRCLTVQPREALARTKGGHNVINAGDAPTNWAMGCDGHLAHDGKQLASDATGSGVCPDCSRLFSTVANFGAAQ